MRAIKNVHKKRLMIKAEQLNFINKYNFVRETFETKNSSKNYKTSYVKSLFALSPVFMQIYLFKGTSDLFEPELEKPALRTSFKRVVTMLSSAIE